MNKIEYLLLEYVNTATDLAEAIKRHASKDTKIDGKTILLLNKFTIAANNVAFFTDKLQDDNIKLN